MSVNVLYQTARATGGRDGRPATLDRTFEISLTTRKELGGSGGDGANPEKLFAASCAAFLGAMKVCGRRPRARRPTVMGPAFENLHRLGSRRFIRSPHRRSPATTAECSGRAPSPS
jgi:hypothetical protein